MVNKNWMILISVFIFAGCSNTEVNQTKSVDLKLVTSIVSASPQTQKMNLNYKLEAETNDLYFILMNDTQVDDQITFEQTVDSAISPQEIKKLRNEYEKTIVRDAKKIEFWIDQIELITKDAEQIKDFFYGDIDGEPTFIAEEQPAFYHHTLRFEKNGQKVNYSFNVDEVGKGVFTKNVVKKSFKKYKLTEEKRIELKAFLDSLVKPTDKDWVDTFEYVKVLK